jgi:hypothetical protein
MLPAPDSPRPGVSNANAKPCQATLAGLLLSRLPVLLFVCGPCMVLRVVAGQAAREVPGGLPPGASSLLWLGYIAHALGHPK